MGDCTVARKAFGNYVSKGSNLSQSCWAQSKTDIVRPSLARADHALYAGQTEICSNCLTISHLVLSTLFYSFVNRNPYLYHFYLCNGDNISLVPSSFVEEDILTSVISRSCMKMKYIQNAKYETAT